MTAVLQGFSTPVMWIIVLLCLALLASLVALVVFVFCHREGDGKPKWAMEL
jgi:hypothetical protein